MEPEPGQVRLRLLSPQVRLAGEEMEVEVAASTTVSQLKSIILTRLQGQGQAGVKVG